MSEDIGNKIKELRKKNGQTLEDIATIVGVGKSTVAKWENGRIANMRRDKIDKLARPLRTSPTSLMGWDNKNDVPMERKKADTVEIIPNMKTTKVKVYGSVPAGVPIEAIEDIQGTVDIPSEWLSNGYDYMGIIVKGSSMYPKYMEGDIVVIRVQPDCENGQDCVVYVNGDEATLKKVIKNTDCIVLQPLNPEYTPIVIDYNSEDFKILGVVVQLVRYV